MNILCLVKITVVVLPDLLPAPPELNQIPSVDLRLQKNLVNTRLIERN
jgi:hypothetical protein